MKTKKWYLTALLFLCIGSAGSHELYAMQTSFSFRSSISSLYTRFQEWYTPKTIGISLLAGAVCLAGCKFFNIFPFKKQLKDKPEDEGRESVTRSDDAVGSGRSGYTPPTHDELFDEQEEDEEEEKDLSTSTRDSEISSSSSAASSEASGRHFSEITRAVPSFLKLHDVIS